MTGTFLAADSVRMEFRLSIQHSCELVRSLQIRRTALPECEARSRPDQSWAFDGPLGNDPQSVECVFRGSPRVVVGPEEQRDALFAEHSRPELMLTGDNRRKSIYEDRFYIAVT